MLEVIFLRNFSLVFSVCVNRESVFQCKRLSYNNTNLFFLSGELLRISSAFRVSSNVFVWWLWGFLKWKVIFLLFHQWHEFTWRLHQKYIFFCIFTLSGFTLLPHEFAFRIIFFSQFPKRTPYNKFSNWNVKSTLGLWVSRNNFFARFVTNQH